MDWGSVAGLLLGLAAILLGQLLEGGRLSSLFQPAALMIVLAGTLGAVLLQSGLPTFLRGIRLVRWAFVPPQDDPDQLLRDVGLWSLTARREGLLSLERFLDRTEDPLAAKGLRLLTDGVSADKLRSILDIELDAFETRHRQAIRIWEAAGGYAPTIGILGAVLGLIHVMENLSDPSRLGSGIAVAFVATIYGVGLANLLFLPIGNKLKNALAGEVRRQEMLCAALCAIAIGDSPHVIEERMLAYQA